VEQLKECLAVAEIVLGAANGEATDSRAANVVTCTELIGELNFFVSFCEIASRLDFEPPCFSAVLEQLGTVLAEVADLHRANEELAGKLVEATRLRDELVDWARGSAAMVRINRNRCVALERAVEVAFGLVQLTGSDLREQALGFSAQIREVMAHDVCHGLQRPLLSLTFVFGRRWTCMRWSLGSHHGQRCPRTSTSDS
jgi:hypothetical protein